MGVVTERPTNAHQTPMTNTMIRKVVHESKYDILVGLFARVHVRYKIEAGLYMGVVTERPSNAHD